MMYICSQNNNSHNSYYSKQRNSNSHHSYYIYHLQLKPAKLFWLQQVSCLWSLRHKSGILNYGLNCLCCWCINLHYINLQELDICAEGGAVMCVLLRTYFHSVLLNLGTLLKLFMGFFNWSNSGKVHKRAKCFCWYVSCRNVKPLIAQLTRTHIITPKAPIHVTLNPRVQTAPSPCPIFVTGCEQPMKLSQSAYWILRLPFPFSIQNVLQTLLTSLYCLNRDTCSKAIHL